MRSRFSLICSNVGECYLSFSPGTTVEIFTVKRKVRKEWSWHVSIKWLLREVGLQVFMTGISGECEMTTFLSSVWPLFSPLAITIFTFCLFSLVNSIEMTLYSFYNCASSFLRLKKVMRMNWKLLVAWMTTLESASKYMRVSEMDDQLRLP